MTKLRELCFILDTNDISICARYIKTTANIWADRLSRKIDYGDRAFNLRHYNHHRHTIDRFATMKNARLLLYNSHCRHSCNETTDSLHLSDSAWRRKHNWQPGRKGGPPPPTPGPVRAKRGVALAGQSRRTLDIAFTGDGRKLLACDSDGVAWLTPCLADGQGNR
eukprot:jgi/Tetstr1/455359/TSEL_042193.t1